MEPLEDFATFGFDFAGLIGVAPGSLTRKSLYVQHVEDCESEWFRVRCVTDVAIRGCQQTPPDVFDGLRPWIAGIELLDEVGVWKRYQ